MHGRLVVCYLFYSSPFYVIFFVLCFHSIELDCDMKSIATMFSKRIAYNIGGKLLTADDLNHIM
jgi:hypothetical protein